MIDKIIADLKTEVTRLIKDRKTGNVDLKINVVQGKLSKVYNLTVHESRVTSADTDKE